MSIRLKLDGTVEADSVEELIAYQNSLRGGRARGSSRQLEAESEERLPEAARKLVMCLLHFPDGMNTADVAKELGVEPKGVGGSVTSLTAWGRRHNFTKKQLLEKERRVDGHGHVVRRIALSDRFRKMVEKGEVPGMKLDT